jgi:hypothetical protein
MLRLVLEQIFLQVFERALEPLDRERIRALVQQAVREDRPELLKDLVRELAFVGPVERTLADWLARVPRPAGNPPPEPPPSPPDVGKPA